MYNILIVDDDFRDRNGICNTIKKFKLPLTTYTADGGSEALNLLQKEKIDILMTDIQMPDMLGTELAEIARKSNPDLTIILVSAHKDFQYAQSAINFGAIKYLLKPYFIDELVSTLNDAIHICDTKSQNNIPAAPLKEANNEYVLNFLEGKSGTEPQSIEEIIGQGEVQLILLKFLGEQKELTDFYSNLNDYFKSSFFLQIPQSQCIVFNKNKLFCQQEDFEDLIHIFREEYKNEICIAYSPFVSIAQLPNEYKNLCQTGEYFFFTNIGLAVSSKDILSTINEGSLSVDSIMDKIQLLIEIDNYTDFVPMISLLFNTLQHTSHFSALYAKCISSNIINMLYKKHRLNTSEQETLVKIFSSNSADEIILLFKEIIDNLIDKDDDKEVNRLISKTFRIIEDEYMNNISLEYIAEKLYVSPAHLSRLFKKHTGKNFIDFLKEYRLKKARDLLKNTNIRINEIAKMVGYDSASYFTTIFHKYYNTTPAQFREKGDN